MPALLLQLIPICLIARAALDMAIARIGCRVDAALAALELRGRDLGGVPLARHAAAAGVAGRRARESHIVAAGYVGEIYEGEG